MKYAWIDTHRNVFEVEAMCRVLAVSKSGFYASLKRPLCTRSLRTQALLDPIKRSFNISRQTYGAPRVFKDLQAQDIKVCENTVAKIMRENRLRAEDKKAFVPCTTDANHNFPIVENKLDRDFQANAPNRKWVADITYVATVEGWLYVAAVLDLYSRKIIGWSMAEHMRESLVEDALKMALLRRKPGRSVLHHSDRGSQYACGKYRSLLARNGFTCSMSRTGNCYDNAVMESFWGTLKTELIYRKKYQTREAAHQSIFEYIEVFYNRSRRHSSLGYVSPEAFEAAAN